MRGRDRNRRERREGGGGGGGERERERGGQRRGEEKGEGSSRQCHWKLGLNASLGASPCVMFNLKKTWPSDLTADRSQQHRLNPSTNRLNFYS